MTKITNERPDRDPRARWYVVHTFSGHENKVQKTMELMVENQGMEDMILEVAVPVEEYVEIKDGVEAVKERKLYPSYVLVNMILTDETWYLVRNTQGVTGFLGPTSNPIPLSPEEEESLGVREPKVIVHDFQVGDTVKVTDGPFLDFLGEILEVNVEEGTVTVGISMLGRDTELELEFGQVEKQ